MHAPISSTAMAIAIATAATDSLPAIASSPAPEDARTQLIGASRGRRGPRGRRPACPLCCPDCHPPNREGEDEQGGKQEEKWPTVGGLIISIRLPHRVRRRPSE